MTALAGRRRRSTLLAAGAAAAAIVVAVVLGIIGGVTLYNSTEGADASSGVPQLVFPATPTELLAAVDDGGRLASMAVLVAKPSGGGSVITVPVSADASGGEGDDRLPIDETFQLQGSESLEREAEILLGLAIDEVDIADTERLAALLEPFGRLDVDLPTDVIDGRGDVVAEAGSRTLDAAAAAAVLTARDPSVPAADQYPAAGAVWSAIAEANGDGAELGEDDGVMADVFDGPVGHRGVGVLSVEPDRNPRGVDVVFLDRAELALVFGQVAPGKMSAPNPALAVRVESPFSASDLAELGMTNTDVAYAAVSTLLFVRGNVLSVDTTPGDVQTTTSIDVADESLISGTEGAASLFGPIDVDVGDTRIVGVDAVIRLGTDYLAQLAEGRAEPAGTTADD